MKIGRKERRRDHTISLYYSVSKANKMHLHITNKSHNNCISFLYIPFIRCSLFVMYDGLKNIRGSRIVVYVVIRCCHLFSNTLLRYVWMGFRFAFRLTYFGASRTLKNFIPIPITLPIIMTVYSMLLFLFILTYIAVGVIICVKNNSSG